MTAVIFALKLPYLVLQSLLLPRLTLPAGLEAIRLANRLSIVAIPTFPPVLNDNFVTAHGEFITAHGEAITW